MKYRVIPTILTDGSTVVKGTGFDNWRTVGTAENLAQLFSAREVDELIFMDVKARDFNRTLNLDLIEKFASTLSVPFGVGGGISSLQSASDCLRAGAEKVIIGTSAIENPGLVSSIAERFGQQAVSVTIDLNSDQLTSVGINSGKKIIELDVIEFALQLQEFGAGEIILQSISRDGLRKGMDLQNISLIAQAIDVPLVASSGAGKEMHFQEAIDAGASAVAAGAIFQFSSTTPQVVSNFLKSKGYPVRIP